MYNLVACTTLVKDFQESSPMNKLLSHYRKVMDEEIVDEIKLQVESGLQEIMDSVCKRFNYHKKDLRTVSSSVDIREELETQLEEVQNMFEMINLKQYLNYQLSKSQDGAHINISLERTDAKDALRDSERIRMLITDYLEQQKVPFNIQDGQTDVEENEELIKDEEHSPKRPNVKKA